MADVLVIVFVCFCLLKQENFSSLTFMEFNNQLDQFETICAQKIVKNESIKNEYLFNECINDFLLSDIGDIEESNTTLFSTKLSNSTSTIIDIEMLSINIVMHSNVTETKNPQLESFQIIFLICLYSFTGFVSVFGKYLSISYKR